MELQMDFGPGYRVYFGKDGESLVILLGGGTKRRQQKDIEMAQELWRDSRGESVRDDGIDEELQRDGSSGIATE